MDRGPVRSRESKGTSQIRYLHKHIKTVKRYRKLDNLTKNPKSVTLTTLPQLFHASNIEMPNQVPRRGLLRRYSSTYSFPPNLQLVKMRFVGFYTNPASKTVERKFICFTWNMRKIIISSCVKLISLTQFWKSALDIDQSEQPWGSSNRFAFILFVRGIREID